MHDWVRPSSDFAQRKSSSGLLVYLWWIIAYLGYNSYMFAYGQAEELWSQKRLYERSNKYKQISINSWAVKLVAAGTLTRRKAIYSLALRNLGKQFEANEDKSL